jgi:hypothetical protein
MIHVNNPIPEPIRFRVDCRHEGEYWISENPTAKPKDFPSYWRRFEDDLAKGFSHRCGWWAMYIPTGHVDHFLSKDNRPDLAYEWNNYRYIEATVNSTKKKLDDQILDPFEVEDAWFELILPSMQLTLTSDLPPHLKTKADLTLEKLHLIDGLKVVRNRKRWYDSYTNGTPLSELEKLAPLVAKAVKKLEDAGKPLP